MLSNITKVLLIILTVSSIGYVFLTHNHNSTVGFQSPEHDQAIPTSFQDFYHEFHTDSLFQLQHVISPKTMTHTTCLITRKWARKRSNNTGGTHYQHKSCASLNQVEEGGSR